MRFLNSSMRKITAGLFISLDGVVEDPQDWHFPYFHDEMGAAVDGQLGAADRLFARPQVLRDSFAGAWRTAKPRAARTPVWPRRSAMRARSSSRTRISSSSQLRAAEGDLVETVTALKNEPGAMDIAMSGSVSVVRQLLTADLLDELHLLVHPTPSAKGCVCSTRATLRSRCGWSPPRPSPPAFCISPTPRPKRLPWARTKTRKRTCPRLRTADIPHPGVSSRCTALWFIPMTVLDTLSCPGATPRVARSCCEMEPEGRAGLAERRRRRGRMCHHPSRWRPSACGTSTSGRRTRRVLCAGRLR